MGAQTTTQHKTRTTGWRPAVAASVAVTALSMTACAGPAEAPTQAATKGELRPAEPIVELKIPMAAATTPAPEQTPVATTPAVHGAVAAAPAAVDLVEIPAAVAQAQPVQVAEVQVAQQRAVDGAQVYRGVPVDGYVTAPEGLPEGTGYAPVFTRGETVTLVAEQNTAPEQSTGSDQAPASTVVTEPAPEHPAAQPEPVAVVEPAPDEQVQDPAPAGQIQEPAPVLGDELSEACSTYSDPEIAGGWACPPAGMPEDVGHTPGFALGRTFDPVTGEYTGPGEAPAPVVGAAPKSEYIDILIG